MPPTARRKMPLPPVPNFLRRRPTFRPRQNLRRGQPVPPAIGLPCSRNCWCSAGLASRAGPVHKPGRACQHHFLPLLFPLLLFSEPHPGPAGGGQLSCSTRSCQPLDPASSGTVKMVFPVSPPPCRLPPFPSRRRIPFTPCSSCPQGAPRSVPSSHGQTLPLSAARALRRRPGVSSHRFPPFHAGSSDLTSSLQAPPRLASASAHCPNTLHCFPNTKPPGAARLSSSRHGPELACPRIPPSPHPAPLCSILPPGRLSTPERRALCAALCCCSLCPSPPPAAAPCWQNKRSALSLSVVASPLSLMTARGTRGPSTAKPPRFLN